MISSTVRTQLAQRSVTMAAPIRLEWRPVQNGSPAVTWTRAPARRRGTSSAWNFSLRLTHSTARPPKAIRPKRLTLPSTPGVARSRRVALSATSGTLLFEHKKLLLTRSPVQRVTAHAAVQPCPTRRHLTMHLVEQDHAVQAR